MNLKRFCISAPASIHAYKMANLAGIQALFYSHFTTSDVYWDSKPRLLLKFEGGEIQLKVLINGASGLSSRSLTVSGRLTTVRGISSGRLTTRYSSHEGRLGLISVVH